MNKEQTKESRFDVWKNRVSWVIRETETRVAYWKDSLDWFEAKKISVIEKNSGKVEVPYLYAIFSTLLPSLISHFPKIAATPTKPEDMGKSVLVEKIIEDIAKKAKLYDEIFAATYSSLLFGAGVVKLGFYQEKKQVSKTEKEIYALFQEQVPQGSAEEFGEFVSGNDFVHETIEHEGVWVEYIPIEDVFFDPEAMTLESCRYVVHKVLMNKKEFKQKFGNVEVSTATRVKASEKVRDEIPDYITKDPDTERYQVYEIWDKPNRKRMVMVLGHDKFLEEKPWPHQLKEYPFEVLTINPKINSIYGLNIINMYSPIAKIINDMTTSQVDNAQRAKSGMMHLPDAIDDDQKAAFTGPGNKVFVEVTNPQGIKEFTTPPVPAETYVVKTEAMKTIEEGAHVSSYARQTTPNRKETATAVREMSEKKDILVYSQTRQIERFVERIVGKIIVLVRQYYQQENLVKIDGIFGVDPFFMAWQGEDIGQFTFEVKVGSAAHQDTAIKTQQSMQFLKIIFEAILSPIGPMVIPNPTPLIQELLLIIGDGQGVNHETIKQAFQQQPSQQPMLPGMGGALGGGGGGGEELPPVPSINRTAPALPGASLPPMI